MEEVQDEQDSRIYKVLNKWNGCEYLVLEQENGMVTLQRDDGSELTIEAKEFRFNYKNIDEKHGK